MTDVVTVGESMAAFSADGLVASARRAAVSVAGSEGNVAVGLARLGHAVRWAGVVGDDGLGRMITRTYAAEGVDVAAVRVDDDAPTGILVREERLAGLARVDYHRRSSAGSTLGADDVLAALTPRPAILHVSGITSAISASAAQAVAAGVRAAHDQGVTVSLDVNYRSRLWSAEAAREALVPLLPMVDVLTADPTELRVLLPEVEGDRARAQELLGAGVRDVVIKEGARGARAVLAQEEAQAPAYAVTAVDPIGAGDAFVAGYLSGLLDGLPLRQRLERGNALGAFVVATAGDWEGLPRRDELGLLDQAAGTVVR